MISIDIAGMFYTAPALLHPLVRKCYNAEHEIPPKIAKMLDARGLTENGEIPEDIKKFILEKIALTADGGIEMQL